MGVDRQSSKFKVQTNTKSQRINVGNQDGHFAVPVRISRLDYVVWDIVTHPVSGSKQTGDFADQRG
jgi:hypothetical protein